MGGSLLGPSRGFGAVAMADPTVSQTKCFPLPHFLLLKYGLSMAVCLHLFSPCKHPDSCVARLVSGMKEIHVMCSEDLS